MAKSKIYILLPSDKDGGGNRWSYLLANNLSYVENFDINLHVCKTKNEKKNIYPLNDRVKKSLSILNYQELLHCIFLQKKQLSQLVMTL